jgi:hypothetical protein
LKASDNVQPEPPRAVFAATPVLLYGEMENDSDDRVELAWNGGNLTFDVPSGDAETGDVMRLLRGSRLITDWESRYPTEEAVAPLKKRRKSRVAARLLELSKTYGLANREVSLVAVVKRLGDRLGGLPDTRVVPVGMPQDTLFPAYFRGPAPRIRYRVSFEAAALQEAPPLFRRQPAGGNEDRAGEVPQFERDTLCSHSAGQTSGATEATPGNADLVDLAAMLEPDGGMPGENSEVRTARTMAAVLAFVAAGHTLTAGAFRLHVTRLVGFIKSITLLSGAEDDMVRSVLDAASTGKARAGTWLALARELVTRREQIEQALET